MARRRLSVVVTAVGFAWEDPDTRERLPCEDGDSAAAPDLAAYPVLAKILDDGKSAWLVIQRRDRECPIPIEMSIDEWWHVNAGRQAGAEAARRIAFERKQPPTISCLPWGKRTIAEKSSVRHFAHKKKKSAREFLWLG